MFGIDFSEILVIFGIALVVLGPERLPKLAATIGRWIGRARAMARQFREQLEQEANAVHHGVDLGPEFGRGPIRPAPKPEPSSQPSTATSTPGQSLNPTVPADSALAESVSGTAVPSGAAPITQAAASPAEPSEFTLADTHPAGLNPPPPSAAAAAAGPAPAAGDPREPQQQMLWPPDGAL